MCQRKLRAVYCTLMLACVLTILNGRCWAQGAKRTAANSGAAERQEKEGSADRVRERQEWQRRGRTALGENSADLLHRAFQQKMKLRDARIAKESKAVAAKSSTNSAAAASLAPSTASAFANLSWSNLGPAPIISDPTHVTQDYGNITGRVTAIAVDQRESTGNTVYVGGAFGGV